jgi:hypothetical protein
MPAYQTRRKTPLRGTTANLDTQLILHTRWQFGPCSVGSTFNLLERYLRNTGLASSLDVSDQAIEMDSIAAPPQACVVTRPGEALGDVAAGIGTDDEIYGFAYALSLESWTASHGCSIGG